MTGSHNVRAKKPRVSKVEQAEDDHDDIDKKPFKPVEIDIATGLKKLQDHKSFWTEDGIELKDLAKFDDLGPYEIDEDTEMVMWQIELKRLAQAAEQANAPTLEGDPKLFGHADQGGYNRLHTLVWALELANTVCGLDMEFLLLKHWPALASSERILNLQLKSSIFCGSDADSIRDKSIGEFVKNNKEAYHAIVNYITAILARTYIRVAENPTWIENCLGSLARLSAKLKVVGNDIPGAISDVLSTLGSKRIRLTLHRHNDDTQQDVKNPHGRAWNDRRHLPGWFYYMTKMFFAQNASGLFWHILSELTWGAERNQSSDDFEASAIIYHTGFRFARGHLCQQLAGEIGVTGSRHAVRCAGVAFDVCKDVWTQLKNTSVPKPGLAVLDWSWTENAKGEVQTQSRTLVDMKHVITALVPHAMFCGQFASLLSDFCFLAMRSRPLTQSTTFYLPSVFLATSRICTGKYTSRKLKESQTGKSLQSRIEGVYGTMLAQERALALTVDDQLKTKRRQNYDDTNKKYEQALEQVGEWTIDRNCITVTSVWYSYAVLGLVGLLIMGGLGLMALGQRIPGVDPSNLTVLLWTAAGFIMVYLKSRHVENWPWRDFMQGQVVCHSISEVVSVTKIDPQILIAVLMRNETRMHLEKSGPFEMLFECRDTSGFSIDVPPLVTTAMAGGRIFVRVDSDKGPALVSIAVTTQDNYMSVSVPVHGSTETALICRDFTEPSSCRMRLEGQSEETKLPLYTLVREAAHWYDVQGVFVENACFT